MTEDSPAHEKRAALERVLEFVTWLRGPQASVDLDDIIKAAADALGYSEDALAVAAHAHKERKSSEEIEQRLRTLLREAGDGAKKDPVAAVAKLADGLSTLQAKSVDKPICPSVSDLLQEIQNTPKPLTAGWDALKVLDVGFYPGELAYLAGRTGHGKTSFFTNILYNFVNKDSTDRVILFYSHEEPIRSIFLRLVALSISNELGCDCEYEDYWSVKDLQAYLKGEVGIYRGIELVAEALGRVEAFWGSRCNVVWKPHWTVEAIASHALAESQDRKVAAVLVDYLQRIPPSKELGEGPAERRGSFPHWPPPQGPCRNAQGPCPGRGSNQPGGREGSGGDPQGQGLHGQGRPGRPQEAKAQAPSTPRRRKRARGGPRSWVHELLRGLRGRGPTRPRPPT